MDYDYSKLIGKIVEKFGTRANFAETIGLSRQAVSNKLTNKADFDRRDIQEWSKLLGIEPDDYVAYFFTKKV